MTAVIRRWARVVVVTAAIAFAAGLSTAAAPGNSDPQPSAVTPQIQSPGSSWIVAVEPGTAEAVAQDWIDRGYDAHALENYVSISAPAAGAASSSAVTESIGADSRILHVVPDSQGYAASWDSAFDQINAEEWHTAKGDGTGVKVAILDLGFQDWQQERSKGNLPSNVTTVDTCANTSFTADVHGTGVAEIVHKVSPKAQLALVCVNTISDLIAAVEWVVNNDYDVIQMSLNWYGVDSRNDGTGILTEIADWAESHGVVWVNSAANAARAHYSGNYNPAGNGWHRWSGSDQGNDVYVPSGYSEFYLRWNDSYDTDDYYQLCFTTMGSATPPDPANCSNYRENVWEPWWDDYQTGPVEYPAFEVLAFNNTGSPTNVDLWVRRVDGTVNRQITVTTAPWVFPDMQHANGVSSIQAPADAASVIAVGAYDYHNMTMANYSSQGPTFDGRVKPDLIAPSHLPSSVYDEPVGFSGTSAASPVVAGVVANMLSSVYTADMTPAEVRELLLDEFVVNSGFSPTGNPNLTGAGRVRLLDDPTPFSDVTLRNPFLFDIAWLANSGVTTGYSNGTFNPTGQVSRQAMSAFLYRFDGEPAYSDPPTFTDVTGSHPFALEIGWLAKEGISTGYSDGTFRPSGNVTRQAMAAFLYRYLDEPAFTPPATASFSDVPTSHPFYLEIEWLRSTGITTGYSDGTFRASAVVSRQAMAAFLNRLDSL